MFILSLIFCLLIFGGTILGLGWTLADRLALEPAEKITAAVTLSILAIFLFAWAIYTIALPVAWLRVLPFLAALGLLGGFRSLRAALSDPDVVALITGQIIILLWSVGGLALVVSYSGGNWLADWFGHFQRSIFFLERGPRDILFNGFDPITSRPPFANIVNGTFLEITHVDFAHYQLFSTLLSSLVFLPAGLLANRFHGRRAMIVLVLLLMVNPMYAENSTYSWTKLPAAFFTLASLYFFLRAYDDSAPSIHAVLFAINLAAALLTHYSAGPYAVLLGVMWFALGRHRWTQPSWWRITGRAILAGTCILATWFAWTFAVYGIRGSLMTNTSVTDRSPGVINQLWDILLNLRDTFVPHFLRSIDPGLMAQRSSLGWWRDWFFQLYQVNFFFIFGSVAWVAILILLLRQWRNSLATRRCFWTIFILGNAVLGIAGIAVHGNQDVWGLAHICLQPLVLMGLAFLAAHWRRLSRPWHLILISGATVDFLSGIFLQFGVQAYKVEGWFTGDLPISALVASYSIQTQMNYRAKIFNHWVFFGDVFFDHRTEVVVALMALFFITLWLAAPTAASESS